MTTAVHLAHLRGFTAPGEAAHLAPTLPTRVVLHLDTDVLISPLKSPSALLQKRCLFLSNLHFVPLEATVRMPLRRSARFITEVIRLEQQSFQFGF